MPVIPGKPALPYACFRHIGRQTFGSAGESKFLVMYFSVATRNLRKECPCEVVLPRWYKPYHKAQEWHTITHLTPLIPLISLEKNDIQLRLIFPTDYLFQRIITVFCPLLIDMLNKNQMYPSYAHLLIGRKVHCIIFIYQIIFHKGRTMYIISYIMSE